MFFTRKSPGPDINEIKEAIGSDSDFGYTPGYEPDKRAPKIPRMGNDFTMFGAPVPSPGQRPVQRPMARPVGYIPVASQPGQPIQTPSNIEGAPLFVKVDKYREALTTIQEMKSFVNGIKQMFTVLAEMENVRTETLKLMRATTQRLERSIVELDTGLLRPHGVPESRPASDAESRYIEDSLTGLHLQLENLRKELGQMK